MAAAIYTQQFIGLASVDSWIPNIPPPIFTELLRRKKAKERGGGENKISKEILRGRN